MIISLYACQRNIYEQADVQSTSITRLINKNTEGIPFADSAMLAEFLTDKKIIDYKVARKMALLQLGTANNRKDMSWEGYTISEKPVLVYGFDSKPKYYEFIMYDAEHKPAGTCVTHAKKTAPSVVTDLITGTRDYAGIVSKSGGGNVQFFAGSGNNLYVGIPAKGGGDPVAVTDPTTASSITGGKELTDEEQVEMASKINKAQNDSLPSLLNTNSNPATQTLLEQHKASINPVVVDASLQKSLTEYHVARDKFWDGITNIQDTLLKTSDSVLTQNTKGFFDWLGSWFRSIFRGPQTTTQMIGKYLNGSWNVNSRNSLINPSAPSECGPAVLSWMYYIYSGNENQYDYFLPYAGSNPMGLIGIITWGWNRLGWRGRPMSPGDMYIAMGIKTNWNVLIAPWVNTSFNGGGIYNHIQYWRKPSILLSFVGGELHWSTVYGCDRTTYWYGWSDFYFYLWDNGTLTGFNYSDRNGNGVYKHKRIAGLPVLSVPVLWD